ncbi:nucleoporin [Butyriboletus roseoflavus]|nr:nucleoporin [Butyriboletus roseoflavus]
MTHTRTPPPLVDLPALHTAARVLHDLFLKDVQSIPDIADLLPPTGPPSSASYSVFPDDYRVPFQKRRLVGIPDALFQYYNTTSVTSHMGLIPEIGRVWISIDHKLFLWDYIHGQDITSFVDQPDVITHVAVVHPKPSVFVDEISSIMVLCTPVSVLLIGLSTSPLPQSNRKDIKMYATDMSVSTDVEMSSVIGTPQGRIFMAGSQDGSLYELHYQQSESWFGKRVHLINHSVGAVQSLFPRFSSPKPDDRIVSVVSDCKRNCLYTLSAKNVISLYHLASEKTVQLIQTLTNLYKSAQEKAPASPAINPSNFHIIALHVIDPAESRVGVQLVAVTVNGVRLYFSPASPSFSYAPTTTQTGALRPLQLIHVRLPPPNLFHPDEFARPSNRASSTSYNAARVAPPPPPSRPFIVSGLENSCYQDGLTISAQPGDADGTDFVLCTSPDLTRIGTLGQVSTSVQQYVANSQPTTYAASAYATSGNQRPPLTEYATLLTIPGRTWAMASVPGPSLPPSIAPSPAIINELALQFSEPPRQFMILTNVGLTFLVKRRALDYLRAVIEEAQSEGAVQPIIEFRDSFGRDQTCAMLLGLACGSTFLDTGDHSMPGTLCTVSPDVANIAKQAFYDFGERPIWTERVTYGTSESSGSAIFSGRREGFAMYFARLIRPLWKDKITKPGAFGLQELNVDDNLLVTVQKNLYALKEFLDKNPHLFHSTPGDPATSRNTMGHEQEAWKAEQSSVTQLQALLTRTIEAISFVLLLSDYRLGELIAQCDAETQKLVIAMTYEELVTTQSGMNASRALVNIVIDQQIGQQISVDTISEVLQQRCGSFCSTDDVMLYKARENVRKAVESRNPAERQNWLGESLRLFTKGARTLEFEKIREVCDEYRELSYAKGAIELPLSCAQAVDPDNVGFEHWVSGCPSNDDRAKFFEKRTDCYQLVLRSLDSFEEKASRAQTPAEDLDTIRNHAYTLAFSSDDEMFHSTLYDWLISRGLADELLALRPQYLEAHLRREPVTLPKYQLLWQFYVKDGQPLRAAEVLAILAESTDIDLDLSTRIEYFTLAVGNAKSHPITAIGRHETAIAFLTDLEEKLDVAQVQLEVYNALLPHASNPSEEGNRIRQLNKRLFTMSELFQFYAEPFDLPVMKLLVLHVSEHRDEHIVRPIWDRIFEDALDADAQTHADHIIASVVPLGKRFYPSESAFPLRYIATLLISFSLRNRAQLPKGWAPRVLVQCGVPYAEIWDVLHDMYESHVPPFNHQASVQAISADIAILLSDWLEEAKRPQSSTARAELPAGRIDVAVGQYLAELDSSNTETRVIYEDIKRQLRRNW